MALADYSNALRPETRGFSTSSLQNVDDPEKAFADITRQDYESYIQDYRGFEESLIDKAKNDTSLIDRAPEDAAKQSEIAQGVQDRNICCSKGFSL